MKDKLTLGAMGLFAYDYDLLLAAALLLRCVNVSQSDACRNKNSTFHLRLYVFLVNRYF